MKKLKFVLGFIFLAVVGFAQKVEKADFTGTLYQGQSLTQSYVKVDASELIQAPSARSVRMDYQPTKQYRVGGINAQVCDSVLNGNFPSFTAYGSYKDSVTFSNYDLDGIVYDSTIFGGISGVTGGWFTYYEVPTPGDTNYFKRAFSWAQTPTGAANRNWMWYSGILVPDSGATLTWKHKFYNDTWLDAYRVIVIGPAGWDTIVDFADQDARNMGHNVWTDQSVELDHGKYGNTVVEVLFEHYASDLQFFVDIDDIEIVSCYESASGAAPVVEFSGTPTTIYEGQNVTFTDASTNTPTSWAWDFGDGNSSTQQNPVHTYTTAGTYTVALTATNAAGFDVDTKTDYITVTALLGPTVNTTSYTYCTGDAIADLTASANDGGTLTWYSDVTLLVQEGTGTTLASGVLNSVAGTTDFYVTETVSGQESAAVKVSITVNTTPSTPTVVDPSAICDEVTLADLEVIAPSGTVAWYSNSNLSTQIGTGSTIDVNAYIAVGSNEFFVTETSNGCTSDSAKITVTVNAKDDANFYYSSGTYCQGGSDPTPTITTAGGTFSEASGNLVFNTSTGEIDLGGSTIGSYNLTYITGGSCPDTMTSPIVKIVSYPDASITYDKSTYCSDEVNPTPTVSNPGLFTAGNGLSFVSVNTGEIDLAGSTPGSYTVSNIIDTASGCAADTGTYDITILGNDAPSTTAVITLCTNSTADNLTATASNGGTLKWYSDAALSTLVGTGASVDAGISTASEDTLMFYVVEENGSCTSDPATVEVRITGSISAPTATGVTACAGAGLDNITVSGSGGTYTWYSDAGLTTQVGTGMTFAHGVNPDVAGTTTFYVIETQGSCVSSGTSVDVVVNNVPSTPTASATSQVIDYGATVPDLTATGSGGTYTWYTNAGLSTVAGTGTPYTTIINNRTPGTTCFYLTETSNGCESSADSICITVLQEVVDTTIDTVVTGGGTYDTTITTSCDTIINYDFDGGNSVDSSWVDKSMYGLYIFDADTQKWYGQGVAINWVLHYNSAVDITPTDTNMSLFAYSYHDPGGVAASNWITIGPIVMGSGAMTFNWKSLYASKNYRDGYEVLINKDGLLPSHFAGGETLFTVTDNEVGTENDTVWMQHSVNIDPATYGNDTIYLAIHHNAYDMAALYIDDIMMEACQSDTTIDTTYNVVADFVGLPTTINTGQSVNFVDNSQNNPTSWIWSFPGGSPSTSAAQNPTNVSYAAAGNYDVTLIVSNAYGADTITKPNYITVQFVDTSGTNYSVPVANFSYSHDTVQRGNSVTFTDLSTNNPTFWSWTFTGADVTSATTQNATATYNTVGTYSVSLGAGNPGGIDVETKEDIIVVIDTMAAPVSKFRASQRQLYIDNIIEFTDQSSNNPTTWAWTFEGASPSSSTQQHPRNIQYSTSGLFDVTLTTTNRYGTHTELKEDYILVDISTEVEDGFDATLLVFPNPATDIVNIDFVSSKQMGEAELRVINITGQVVNNQSVNVDGYKFQQTLDVSTLPKGVYTVQFVGAEGTLFQNRIMVD